MSVAYIANEVIARVDQTCTASATHHVKWNHFGNVILPGLLLIYTPYMHVLSVDSTCFDKLEF